MQLIDRNLVADSVTWSFLIFPNSIKHRQRKRHRVSVRDRGREREREGERKRERERERERERGGGGEKSAKNLRSRYSPVGTSRNSCGHDREGEITRRQELVLRERFFIRAVWFNDF